MAKSRRKFVASDPERRGEFVDPDAPRTIPPPPPRAKRPLLRALRLELDRLARRVDQVTGVCIAEAIIIVGLLVFHCF